MAKTELDYFDFSIEPGLKQNLRLSHAVGNVYVSIITYYNGDYRINQTYMSLLNQTFPHWEWIIVTNEVDDNIKLLQEKDKRIKLLKIEDKDIKRSQYIAAETAVSDLILLMSSRDLLDKTTLECGYFSMLTNPEGVWAYSRMVDFGLKQRLYNKKLDISEMAKRDIILNSVFIRKDAFLELDKHVDVSLETYEDWCNWLKFLREKYIPIKMDFYGYWNRKSSKPKTVTIESKETLPKEDIDKAKNKIPVIKAIEFDKAYQFDFKDIPQKIDLVKKDIFEKNDKKKILLIAPCFVVGGADLFNLNLIKGLRAKGYEISVITTKKCDYVLRQEVEKYVDEYFDLTTFLKEKAWASFIYHIIKSRKIDCVFITNSLYGYYVLPWLKCHFKNIPFVDYIHAENWTLRNGGFPKDSNSVAEYLDATYTCTKHLRNMMYTIMNRNVKNIKPVYIGTDTSFYDNNVIYDGEEELQEKYKDKEVLLFIGRMVHYKRPLFAIELLKKLLKTRKNVRLMMVGDGAAFEDVKQKIKDENLEEYVHLYGMQDSEQVRKFYKVTDVTLVCSLREGLTLTTYESLAMGVPVVSSDVGGQKELIENDCGAIILPYQRAEEQFDFNYSEEELEEYKIAIEKILDNKENVNYKAVCREKTVSRFSIDKMIINLDKEISKLIKTGSQVDKSFCENIEFAERYLLINGMLENLNKYVDSMKK